MRPHLVILAGVMTFVAQDAAAQGVSSGTAFSVAPELLITNQHVVEGCSSVEVISLDGRRTGSIAAADADVDLAILRVSGLRGTIAVLTTYFWANRSLFSVIHTPVSYLVAETSPQVSLVLCADFVIPRTRYRSLLRYSQATVVVH